MKGLIRFTLRQQILFNLLFVLLMIGGLMATGDLAVERYADINFGKVQVRTFYPGASPQDVESLVTLELEDALVGLDDVELIQATSVRERSTLLVKFRDGSDYDALYDELRFRILGALRELPPEVEPPRFDQITSSYWFPVVAINLIGERSNRALTLIAKNLQLPLSRIPGVDEAQIVGEQVRELHVVLDPNRLSHYGVTFDQVAESLQDANRVIPAGDFTDGSGEYVIRVDERFRSREQIVSTVVRRDADGSFVTVGDLITEARLGYRDPHLINSVNGLDAVSIKLLKSLDGNALEIRDQVAAILAERAPLLAAEGVRAVVTQDSTTYIRESVSTLGWNMLVGMVLVGLVLWYFMGPRNAGLVTIGIPFAFLVTMIFMWATGNSLNDITLFSFVLVSGIVVDDAIVVTENIYRHLQEGESLDQAVVDGTAEVMWPVIASTATTISAFLPMLMMTGMVGEFFALIPKAISFALLASLFECLLILPLHYRDFGPRPRADGPPRGAGRDEPFLRLMRALAGRVCAFTFRFRWTTLGLVLGAFIASIGVLGVSIAGIAPLVRIQFFPDDYNVYYAFIEAPAGTPLTVIDEKVRVMSRLIMDDGPAYAASASGFAGFVLDENYEEEGAHHYGTVMVALPAQGARGFDDPALWLDALRERLQAAVGDGFEVRMRPESEGPQVGKDVNIQVVGTDGRVVDALADALAAAIAADPVLGQGLVQLDAGRAEPERVFQLDIDERRSQELGLTQGQTAELAAAVLDGRYIGKYRLADEEVDLKLSVDMRSVTTPEDALRIPLVEHASGPVYLRDVVQPRTAIESSELNRYRGERSRSISANIGPDAPLSPALVVNWVRDYYRDIQADYPGATLIFAGEFDATQRSFNSLIKAFGLVLLLIYLILAAQFRSYLQPVIVISAIMFSIIGVVLGKLVTQSLFTINSFIAVVGVTGIVVNDSLVLVDFINRSYRGGMSRADAIRRGIDVRLRPIVVTTLTTVLGLLPMAVGFPSYSVVWGTMASTFVTGLATATLLTLFVVPVGWDLLTQLQERRAQRRRERRSA